ncbi:hypothetical protein ABEF95_011410 [Exophiala dermatitidis]
MSAYSTNDLRSAAKPYQREKNQHSKWARGVKTVYSRYPDVPQHERETIIPGRPAPRDLDRRLGRAGARERHSMQNKLSGQAATLARKVFRNEVVEAIDGPLSLVSDTSEEEDVSDASAAPLPAEADFMYSYDAPSGPRNGTDILSHAINQAVQRFENSETEKLVNKEYDVVDGKDMADLSTADDEDEHDFEMIEHSQLK